VYAVNTIAAVAGSLIAGFVAIPLVGLQNTIRVATGLLIAAAIVAGVRAATSVTARVAGLAPAVAAVVFLMSTPPWERELFASGIYKYARNVPPDLDLETMLKAGTLLYYADGATATVSVKRLSGELALAIDGKVDASTSGDMITQKTLAHLPLLLHPDPHDVCIIGLGSGVTLASALVHPVAAVDVVEISPEVVDASRFFAAVNRNALDDRRTRLVVGDGRSHLTLASRTYDVIISEPSNPWMAGVAALFTREFFEAARSRLAPGGIICQWTHTYDISDADLRSVVATFRSVFPNGTMWLVGNGDLLLIGSADDEPRLENISQAWQRPGVAADLEPVSLRDPFGVLSLFVGGRAEMTRYVGDAPLQRDNRMALEFTGPLSVNSAAAAENVATIRRLLDERERPPARSRPPAQPNGVTGRR
jgi:spermidine synthase